MHYHAALDYLYSFLDLERMAFRYRRELNLKRMKRLLQWFDHPESRFKSILVAGTNGKGSTASFITGVLSENGYLTGLYTSPHFRDPRERIRLGGKCISESDFSELMTIVHPVIEGKRKEIESWGPITFFEMMTLLAMIHFAEKGAEFGVFEVGMGGRLDATNVLNPAVSVVTPIGHDHMEHLGKTLAKIATEKAAVIKPNSFVVSGRQAPEAKKVLREQIKKTASKGYFLGEQFRADRSVVTARGGRFCFEMEKRRTPNLKIRLPGQFQIENAATAIAAVSVLRDKAGLEFEPEKVKQGLKKTFWPGRFEVVEYRGRTCLFDIAHNEESAIALSEGLKTFFPKRKKVFIFGSSREKQHTSVLKCFSYQADYFIATRSRNPRAQLPKNILESLSEIGFEKPTFWSSDVGSATQMAKRLPLARALWIFTGSLFLVAEAREHFKCQKFT